MVLLASVVFALPPLVCFAGIAVYKFASESSAMARASTDSFGVIVIYIGIASVMLTPLAILLLLFGLGFELQTLRARGGQIDDASS